MTRGYLWIDWVELGCRGWDLVAHGAEVDAPEGYAVLTRQPVALQLAGDLSFIQARLDDLRVAGLFRPAEAWTLPTTGTAGSAFGALQIVAA